jgi:acyl-CoA synthetase (NDP forming)
VDTVSELFEVASLLANQPPPPGRRVGILTNAGGPGILCADACAAAGLEVPPLRDETRAELAGFLPAEAGLANPVDMIASAPPGAYERAISVLGARPDLDALIVIFIKPLAVDEAEVAAAIHRGAAALDHTKPVLAVFMSAAGPPAELRLKAPRIPCYPFPEPAARALARAADWEGWRGRPPARAPVAPAGIRRDAASAILAARLRDGGGWLDAPAIAGLLESHGVRLAPWRVARTVPDAVEAAAELGGDVALKALAPTLLHKSDAGAVAVSLHGAAAVRRAAREMGGRLRAAGHRLDGFLVQTMVPAGVEMIVGLVNDPLFGPLVAVGAGGTTAELLKDVSVRLTPLTPDDADEMVHALASFPLLDGYRGQPGADVAALRDLLLRVSALAEQHEEIAELDLNPVVVGVSGAVVVDARVRVEPTLPRPPEGSRPRSV